jgi:hypothetical protein
MSQPTFGLPSSAPHLPYPTITHGGSFGKLPNGSYVDVSLDVGRESYPPVIIDMIVNTCYRDATDAQNKSTTPETHMEIGELCFIKPCLGGQYQNSVGSRKQLAGSLYNLKVPVIGEKFTLISTKNDNSTAYMQNLNKNVYARPNGVWSELHFVGAILNEPPKAGSTTSQTLTTFQISKYAFIKNYWYHAGLLVAGTTLWLLEVTMPDKRYDNDSIAQNGDDSVTIIVPWASSGYQDPRTFYDNHQSRVQFNFENPISSSSLVNIAADPTVSRTCRMIGTLLHSTPGNHSDELLQVDLCHNHGLTCFY